MQVQPRVLNGSKISEPNRNRADEKKRNFIRKLNVIENSFSSAKIKYFIQGGAGVVSNIPKLSHTSIFANIWPPSDSENIEKPNENVQKLRQVFEKKTNFFQNIFD